MFLTMPLSNGGLHQVRTTKLILALLTALCAVILLNGSTYAEEVDGVVTEVSAEIEIDQVEAPPVDAAPPDSEFEEAGEATEGSLD
jgi:hypothetical protein